MTTERNVAMCHELINDDDVLMRVWDDDETEFASQLIAADKRGLLDGCIVAHTCYANDQIVWWYSEPAVGAYFYSE